MSTSVIKICLALLLLLLGGFLLAVASTLKNISSHELRQRKKQGNLASADVYSLLFNYTRGLQFLSVTLGSLLMAGAVALLISATGKLIAAPLSIVLIWTCSVLIRQRLSKDLTVRLISYVASPLSASFRKIQPTIQPVLSIADGPTKKKQHYIYSKAELFKFLHTQSSSPYSDLSMEDAKLMESTLDFNHKTVEDFMLPLKNSRLVSASDELSMGLIDDLHKTNQTHFAVYMGGKHDIIGTIEIGDILRNHKTASLKVRNLANENISFIEKTEPAEELIARYLESKNPAFIVVDESSQAIGIVTIHKLLGEIFKSAIKPSAPFEEEPDSSQN